MEDKSEHSQEAAISQQPHSTDSIVLEYPGESGPVVVRNLQREDSDFAGNMLIEAFRAKSEWCVGKHNLEELKHITSRVNQRKSDLFFQRTFLALHNGERAGLLFLKFHGDEIDEGGFSDFSGLGCCALWGLFWMVCYFTTIMKIPRRTCYLDTICVDAAFRGKGIGKALMEKAENEARRQNCTSIYLWVAGDNRAQNLYQREGYTIVDEKSGCFTYRSTGVRKFYKMSKDLV